MVNRVNLESPFYTRHAMIQFSQNCERKSPGLEGCMSRTLRVATIAIAWTFAGAGALAAPATSGKNCAKPEEMTAMQTAAVQQELMVAALSCNAVTLYNAFVTGYQKELQDSDKSLQKLFLRLRGKRGIEDYHAFKTKLANGSSIKSIGNITQFCANAQAAFSAALGPAKSTLKDFVAGHADSSDNGISACEYKQNTIEAMKAVPHIQLKKPAKKKSPTAAATTTQDTAVAQ
jgi:hypothetical protein